MEANYTGAKLGDPTRSDGVLSGCFAKVKVIEDPMRGPPGSPINTARQNSQKRFPHRFRQASRHTESLHLIRRIARRFMLRDGGDTNVASTRSCEPGSKNPNPIPRNGAPREAIRMDSHLSDWIA